LILFGGRGRNRTYNLSVKRGPVSPGVRLFSSEYSGRFRQIWSPFGTLFGEQFGDEVSIRFCRILIRFEYPVSYRMVELAPTSSGNLVVDRTDKGFAQNQRHRVGMPPSRIRTTHHVLAVLPWRCHCELQVVSSQSPHWQVLNCRFWNTEVGGRRSGHFGVLPIRGLGTGLTETNQPVQVFWTLADLR